MVPVYDIVDFGAVPDGKTDNSGAFSLVFAKICATGEGTVLLPPGEFLSGPIELPDNTTLYLSRGAILSFVPDPGLYEPVETRWEGIICHAMHPLIFVRNAKNVAIRGEGVIDGKGKTWWEAHRGKKTSKQTGPSSPIEKQLAALNGFLGDQPSGGGGRETQFLRPPLVQFLSCSGVTIEGVTIRNSPFWTVHPVFSEKILIKDVRIENPADAPNTDGIDIDSCSEVTIIGTVVDVGDDCLALKSGSGPRGLAEGRSTRNVTISNCTFFHGHGGVVIGSETAGGIENVDVSNCRFIGTDRGIRVKSRRGRGGTIQNLFFRNLVMEKVLAPLTINLFYNCGAKVAEAEALFSRNPAEVTALTPKIRNVSVSNLVARECRASAGFIAGLPESRIENLLLENCSIAIANENLVPACKSEMYQGLAETEYRGMRLGNVICSINGVNVENCIGEGFLAEEGCSLGLVSRAE